MALFVCMYCVCLLVCELFNFEYVLKHLNYSIKYQFIAGRVAIILNCVNKFNK